MYQVIRDFTDLHDNDYAYHAGDIFPREGIRVSKNRLRELAGSENRQGIPLIESVEEESEDVEDGMDCQKRGGREWDC